jgi:hypothetical protein
VLALTHSFGLNREQPGRLAANLVALKTFVFQAFLHFCHFH